MGTPVIDRIERLNRASAKRVIDPDVELVGNVGDGQLLPDELLSVHGLDVHLTPERRRTLAREEVASIFDNGIRFEAILEAGFALQIARSADLNDARITYLLHEMGEETRHQRLFQRVRQQIEPTAGNPFADVWIMGQIDRYGSAWIINHLPMLYVMVLAGEEIPDLLQKLASEHPDTDPFLAQLSRYHRQEEARHLSFARAMLPEIWAKATTSEKVAVRRVAPLIITQMFTFLVQPGVYETVGLPGWATWKAVNRLPERIALRQQATRPVLATLLDAGVVATGRIPRAWQKLCGVDAKGRPVVPAVQPA
ncbi:diiron oxygenase [Aquihabitans sp. McL0605]|uniref:diiron oxygenase n=1 Tax=Aquihabitans sp. McL0605 TaxID=3415671 RepID=UPI003CED164F